ncbi:MAG: type II toxin-antitoxin system RelE/ParE family toxin [Spirosomaceae bacterium]|jgi:mRNA-degrading endonuclease RelE of RelBE toxin-antitoxin system|nr:type II toxin-antitoxin system RelE/ParE family toxin [Spirosomataceae bacterium]
MSFEIIATKEFDRELKKLSKRYASFKYDYLALVESLENNPTQGTPLGKDCYKIRLSISAKGKGKSGGVRIITHVKIMDEKVYLLSIYDKSDQTSISDKEILTRLNSINP